MFIFFFVVCLCFNLSICVESSKKAAVSYKLNGGRFGDNLRSCIQAYWLAYINNFLFLYVPFPWSEKLNMHTVLQHGSSDILSTYKHIRIFERHRVVTITDRADTVYVTTFYSDTHVNWKDPLFLQELKQLIMPLCELDIPSDISASIALHVRRGGSFAIDTDSVKKRRPAHFPAILYYAHALDYLLSIIDGTYTIYLFTDDENPELLAAEITQQLKQEHAERITIKYRTDYTGHNSYVLDDFFAMQKAQYLIRPKSNFSLYAQRLGDHAITISPARAQQGTPWGIVESIFVDENHMQQEILLV
jgi:hypothetical protein